eukprot:6159963-Alexandrium_andersonii.AAC.1
MAARQQEQAAREARERARTARWESRQAHAMSAFGSGGADGRVPDGVPTMGPAGSLPAARTHGGGHSWGPPVVLAPRPPDHPPPPH